MEWEEKVKEGDREREEFMEGKLRLRVLVGKREGNTTPSPNWKFGFIQPDGSLIQDFNFPTNSASLSARKLGANLWEVLPQVHLVREANMSKNRHVLDHGKEEKASGFQKQMDKAPLEGPSLLKIGIDSRKKVEAEKMQHNERIQGMGEARRPLSPASCSSSMQMASPRPATSPTSSQVSRGKYGDYGYSLKTSTELLKVLNRIWSLEEKHALDMSLVKTLRTELDQAQARIKELLLEKKTDQKAIDHLIKQINEEKVAPKNKEQDRIKDAVKLVREELEDEMKLRKRVEKMYHKLVEEIPELKSSVSNSVRELERETKGRRLLEDLCDEFARAVIDYEQEVRFMKQKSFESQMGKEGKDRLVLHIAEAWLDERTQRKLDNARGTEKTSSVLDKMSFEIKTFLRAKQSRDSEKDGFPSPEKASTSRLRLHSLESLQLNDPGSAPWNGNDQDDSVSSEHRKGSSSQQAIRKQGKRINLDGNLKEKAKVKMMKGKSRKSVEDSDVPGLQVQLDEELEEDRQLQQPVIRDSSSEHADLDQTNRERMLRKNEVIQRASSKKIQYDDDYIKGYFDPSTFAGPPSPVKKWTSEIRTTDPDMYEYSSGRPQDSKPNTLKAKLLEARLEGQRSRSRVPRGVSLVD